MLTNRKILIIILSLAAGLSMGQGTLTLDSCYRLAERNWPLVRQIDLIAGSSDLKVKNLNKNYLPQSNLNGSASYQSDVTQVSVPLPAGFPPLDMPTLSKDWYKAALDINQTIWDGNVTSYNKKLEKYNREVDQTAVRSELYKLKDRVNQIYFSILLLNANDSLLADNYDRVGSKLKEVNVAVRNGAALQMNADVLQAELIRIAQMMDESAGDRKAACGMLSELLGVPVEVSTRLVMPSPAVASFVFENKRLENEVFNLQESRTGVMRDMVTTKWNPKLWAYGELGYGRPGLNMLEDSFAPWALVGAKFTWTFWNWNANKNEKKILDIQADILRSQQSAFDRNLRIQAERDLAEIEKAQVALTKDQDIIDLRARISKASSIQLDNGVITSSDYVLRLKEEAQARLNYDIHQIQLVKAKLNYLYNQGKL
jgi:outer membrane protein TolC